MEKEFDEVEHIRRELSKLNSVKEMVSTPGWVLVCEHFGQVIQAIQEKLVVEEDFRKVRRLQERLRAFRSMLETVDALCSQHTEQAARLDDIVKNNSERDQYGLE